MKIPVCVVYTGHPVGASASYNQMVDKRIIEKVYDLISRGITRPDEVRQCIDEYVERELLSTIPAAARPRKSNRKYYPTRQDLRNHITKASSAHKYSKNGKRRVMVSSFTDQDRRKTPMRRLALISFCSSSKKNGSRMY